MIPGVVAPPKKTNAFWIISIVCFIIFIIALSVDMSDDTKLTGTWIEAGEDYRCADGAEDKNGRGYITGDKVNDGHDDCSDGSDEDGSYEPFWQPLGSASCCFSILFGIIAISVRRKQQKVIVIQQQPQYIPVVQQVVQPVQRIAPRPAPQPAQRVAPSASTNVANLAETARNLEKARDFEASAKMYQKAGMYEDAGRVRQAHLEKEEQAVVQIGQVGNTVLNDSVMINDGAPAGPKTCWACQSAIEETWAVCPNCEASL
jgi:hypothetical protein